MTDYYIPEIKLKVNNTFNKYDLFVSTVSYGKRNRFKDHVLLAGPAGPLNALRGDEWQKINTKLTRNHNGISQLGKYLVGMNFDGKKTLSKLPHMKE